MREWILARVRRQLQAVGVGLVFGTGNTDRSHEGAVGTLIVHDLRTLLAIVIHPDLYFGEAYMRGRLEVRGDLEEVIEALTQSIPERSLMDRARLWVSASNTLLGARRNVEHHYDLGNDFYSWWLDEELVYSCAFFERPDMTLEQAQRAKMELVSRKLQLRPGETVIEIGSGWGGLALHMARHHGVRVRAFNVSREQLAFSRDRAAREGLSSQVEFIEDDYRQIDGPCDALVSVGMMEHVGPKQYDALAQVLARTMRPGSRGLLQFCGRDLPRPVNPWAERYIFPGGYPPTLAQTATQILAPARMSVIDIENLRLHYARTVEHWAERFAAVRPRALERYGDEFCRAWELYLAGSESALRQGDMQLFQVLFAPMRAAHPYRARAVLYERPLAPP